MASVGQLTIFLEASLLFLAFWASGEISPDGGQAEATEYESVLRRDKRSVPSLAEQQHILDYHNDIRRQAGAADMNKLVRSQK